MTNLALVISDFNSKITSMMEKNAEKVAKSLSAKIIINIHVPGTFEIPFAAKKLFKDRTVQAVIALGAVIQGDTDHDLIIVTNVSQKLMDLSLQYNKPLGFGIIGPRVTRQQAEKRASQYSERAIRTALELIKINKE